MVSGCRGARTEVVLVEHARPTPKKKGSARNLLLAGAVAAVVGLTVWAAAASLTVNSTNTVGAGNATVASCDTDGVTPTYSTSYDTGDGRFEIGTVTITGIAAACSGLTITVNLTNTAGTTSYGSGTATADASGTKAVTITSPGDAANVTKVNVSIA